MSGRTHFGPCAKRMEFGSDLHVTPAPLADRIANALAACSARTGGAA